MATLPAPSVMQDPKTYPYHRPQKRRMVSSAGPETFILTDMWKAGEITPFTAEILCLPTRTYLAHICKMASGNSRDDLLGTFLLDHWANSTADVVTETAQSWLSLALKPASGWFGKIDKIITELGRLKVGWGGDAAQTPSQALLNQIEQVLQALPQDTREPEIEIDPSDASVVTRWWGEGNASAFSMTFTGNGKVYGVVSAAAEEMPASWECDVHDETRIEDRISHPLIRRVLTEAA